MTAALPLALALAAAATPPAPAPAGGATTLVLIVASNRGARGGRPVLQYADDDGAKYHEVFSTIAGEENTVLLTDFDRDTARLFPALLEKVRSPTRPQLDLAAAKLARRAGEAARLGRAVRFHFVFAGHGDVDGGRGFLDLPDGPFTADDLQALLKTVGAAETHVILDSCNSFFVVNPRKPGGARFATPRDAIDALARRLQGVGVFLSTSAHAEVYEWSELQSGVFSHAVRSGLLGAADVNGDGAVSYAELAGFVETAVADIKNPLFRPTVYARGPDGEDARAILAVPGSAHVSLVVDEQEPVRLAVRDVDGLRWVDAYKEAGGKLELWLPSAVARRAEVERLRTSGAERGKVEAAFALDASREAPLRLAALPPATSTIATRGPGEIFEALFARPFGPVAFSAFLARRATEPDAALAAGIGEDTWTSGETAAPMQEPRGDRGEPGRPAMYALVRPGFTVALDSSSGVRPSVALAIGARLASWFAAELEAGYRDATYDWKDGYPSDWFSTGPVPGTEVRVQAIPLGVNLRFQIPLAAAQPYLLVGGGLSFTQATLDPTDFNATLREHDELSFVHAGAGVTFALSPRLFGGFEGRYSLSSTLHVFEGKLEGQGLSGSALLGVRL